MRVTALLQGAMLQEVSLDDPVAFDTALQGLHVDAARECLLARTDEF